MGTRGAFFKYIWLFNILCVSTGSFVLSNSRPLPFTSYQLEALILFVFNACGRGLCYEPSQVTFTCQVGASGHTCFISLVRLQRGLYSLAFGDVERHVKSLLNLN